MKIEVTLNLSEQSRTFELNGRLGWTAAHLVKAGAQGIQTIDRPALRLSAYVHELRGMGFPIETEMVPHGGDYAGHHARYTLGCDCQLTILGQGDAK